MELKNDLKIKKISTRYYVIDKNNDMYGCYKSMRSLKKAMDMSNLIK
jgi:hypothetical protein